MPGDLPSLTGLNKDVMVIYGALSLTSTAWIKILEQVERPPASQACTSISYNSVSFNLIFLQTDMSSLLESIQKTSVALPVTLIKE